MIQAASNDQIQGHRQVRGQWSLNSWILMSSLNNKVQELLMTLVNLTHCNRKHKHKFLKSPIFPRLRVHINTDTLQHFRFCLPVKTLLVNICMSKPRGAMAFPFFEHGQHTVLNE